MRFRGVVSRGVPVRPSSCGRNATISSVVMSNITVGPGLSSKYNQFGMHRFKITADQTFGSFSVVHSVGRVIADGGSVHI